MPYIGEIKYPKEIGRKGTNKYIYLACVDCGKERWVSFPHYRRGLCKRCKACIMLINRELLVHKGGEGHHNWRGGRFISKGQYKGYVMVWVGSEDFFAPMRDKRHYVAEHRLVMAQHLGRCLQSW